MPESPTPINTPAPNDSNASRIESLKVPYALDDSKVGFFWPESPSKRDEALIAQRNAPDTFEAVYQGRPGMREGSIFLESDLNAFFAAPPSLELGVSSPEVRSFNARAHMCAQSWDTAFSTTSAAAHTVCVTGLFVPCTAYHCNEDPLLLGPCEYHFDVLILSVFREKLDWGSLTNALKTQRLLWLPQEILIEKKASGQSLIQAFEPAGFPIVPMPAAGSKRARAVNSIDLKAAGSVQGWFRQHRVLTPQAAPWLDKWRMEMKDFSGNDDASSDQVDATVHLVIRAIQMGSSMAVLPSDWSPERSGIPENMIASSSIMLPTGQDPRAVLLDSFNSLSDWTTDPFDGTCGRCVHDGVNFCPIQARRMLAFDSCSEFVDARDAAASDRGPDLTTVRIG